MPTLKLLQITRLSIGNKYSQYRLWIYYLLFHVFYLYDVFLVVYYDLDYDDDDEEDDEDEDDDDEEDADDEDEDEEEE